MADVAWEAWHDHKATTGRASPRLELKASRFKSAASSLTFRTETKQLLRLVVRSPSQLKVDECQGQVVSPQVRQSVTRSYHC